MQTLQILQTPQTVQTLQTLQTVQTVQTPQTVQTVQKQCKQYMHACMVYYKKCMDIVKSICCILMAFYKLLFQQNCTAIKVGVPNLETDLFTDVNKLCPSFDT